MTDKTTTPEVLVYYFPQYHRDARNDEWLTPGWTEWELVRTAKPRFDGHRQPIVPTWGEFDEADPAWAAREIDLAADHGVTAFLYDWYWYDGAPFLHDGLERGFLGAPNHERLKFALMWANHDWLELFPSPLPSERKTLASGRVPADDFERLTDYVAEHYFTRGNYYAPEGAAYFSIFDLRNFIFGVGGLDEAAAALASFREKARRAGFIGLHVNTHAQDVDRAVEALGLPSAAPLVEALGLSSVTAYHWVHHVDLEGTDALTRPYQDAARANYAAWERYPQTLGLPYHPNVSMGWDVSPRTHPDLPYEVIGYPWNQVLADNTPEAFKDALTRARDYAARNPAGHHVVTVNSWNEWTEGSYLLPDTVHGLAYLEAIAEVFKREVTLS
ncbi:glycoside hydrolase family 99-like domain-containing protein [Deinococcus pimensis]|uniref:glycoside hydrolase family 99-like domain-containing protein n=1 Tax=Deinococcus pimensis TaxID=309888 RepID=UPI000486BAA6|nr:glycoside hydrolase family 99-like domain-containing protein [Deinococcus pimensis]